MKIFWGIIKERKGSLKYLGLAGFLLVLFVIGFIQPSNNSISSKKVPANYRELGGAIYQTFIGGHLIWLAEDLKLEVNGSWCYEGNPVCMTRLYTWKKASKACWAIGYRLPMLEEWEQLPQYVGKGDPNRPNAFNSTYAYRVLVENFNIKFTGKGIAYSNGSSDFSDASKHGYYFTADQKYIDFNAETKTMSHRNIDAPLLLSCRCVKDLK